MKKRSIAFLVLLAGCAVEVDTDWGQVSSPHQPTGGDIAQLTPAEIARYKQAVTVIGWNQHQIREYIHKLQPAESQDQLPALLDHAGEVASRLIRDLPRIACEEEFHSDSYQGRVVDAQHYKFRYIVIPHPEDVLPTLEEYRTDMSGNSLNSAKYRYLPLVTYGFVSTVLLLNPADQREEHFRYFGIQKLHDRECHVIGFAQDPEKAHRIGRFNVADKTCGILLQGLAWVDTKNFELVAINTWLLAPRFDVGLRDQVSRVEFSPTPIADSKLVLSLPSKVAVTVVCGKLLATNTHLYSHYKLFVSESTIKPIP